MLTHPSNKEKPQSEINRPDLTRLPELTWKRKAIRRLTFWIVRVVVKLATRTKIEGWENFPKQGPGLVVTNHLGDADWIIAYAFCPVQIEPVGKIELYNLPVVGKFLDALGTIWIHRGRADKKALRVIQDALNEGRFVAIAPEGRESVSGSLEEGTGGAAYIALKTGVPVIPITVTGSENWRLFGNLKRFRRTPVTVTVGKPFHLKPLQDRRRAIQLGTEKIMLKLAQQLPPEYRGVYQEALVKRSERG